MAARNGQLPSILGMVHVEKKTPLIVLGYHVNVLIKYFSLVYIIKMVDILPQTAA